jgi:hypothetical protein
MKREKESTNLKTQKMIKGIMEPFAMPIVVQEARQTIEVPQMTSLQERHLRK